MYLESNNNNLKPNEWDGNEEFENKKNKLERHYEHIVNGIELN